MKMEVWIQFGMLLTTLWIANLVRRLNVATSWSQLRYEAHAQLIAQGEEIAFLLQRTVWDLDPSLGISLPPRSEELPILGEELRELATSRTRVRLLAGKGSQDAADDLVGKIAYFLRIRRTSSQTWTNPQVATTELTDIRSTLDTYVEVVREELGLGYTIHHGMRRLVRWRGKDPASTTAQSGS